MEFVNPFDVSPIMNRSISTTSLDVEMEKFRDISSFVSAEGLKPNYYVDELFAENLASDVHYQFELNGTSDEIKIDPIIPRSEWEYNSYTNLNLVSSANNYDEQKPIKHDNNAIDMPIEMNLYQSTVYPSTLNSIIDNNEMVNHTEFNAIDEFGGIQDILPQMDLPPMDLLSSSSDILSTKNTIPLVNQQPPETYPTYNNNNSSDQLISNPNYGKQNLNLIIYQLSNGIDDESDMAILNTPDLIDTVDEMENQFPFLTSGYDSGSNSPQSTSSSSVISVGSEQHGQLRLVEHESQVTAYAKNKISSSLIEQTSSTTTTTNLNINPGLLTSRTRQSRKRKQHDEDYVPPKQLKKETDPISDDCDQITSDDDDSDSDYEIVRKKPKPAAKRRGRPPKMIKNEHLASSSLFAINSDDTSDAASTTDKYRSLREKNNEASKKSRQKRKRKEKELESQEKQLTNRNIRLTARAKELEKIIERLEKFLPVVLAGKKVSTE